MANIVTNILPIEVDIKPEARAKPAPDRSQDRDRFERHLENSTSDRQQKSDRASAARQNDTHPAEREARTRRHEKSPSSNKPNRPEAPPKDNSGAVAKHDQTPKTHSAPERIADDDLPAAPRNEESARANAAQPPAGVVSDSTAIPEERADETALITFVADNTGTPIDPLLNGARAEQVATAQVDLDNGADTVDTPDPAANGLPTAIGEATLLQEPAAGETTDETSSTAPITPKPVPDLAPDPAANRPSLPDVALNGLHTAGANIPDHYSGQGRPAEPALIQDLPAVPEDQPLVAALPAIEPQAADPLADELPEFAAQPETGEPLPFEPPDPGFGQITTSQDENTNGIILPGHASTDAAPDGDQPVLASTAETLPVDPLPADLTVPSTAETSTGTKPQTVPSASLDTAIAPTTPEPLPTTPQPVVSTPLNTPDTGPVQQQATPVPLGTESPTQTAAATPSPAERPAAIVPPVQTAPTTPAVPTAPPPQTAPTAPITAPVETAPPATAETIAQPQTTPPVETGRPAEPLVPQAPAPHAKPAPAARADTGLLNQLANIDSYADTPPARPATIASTGNADSATPSTFDKAALNAAAATPQQTAAGNPASITATPPLGAELPLSDVPVSTPASGEPQSTTAPVAQNPHNVSIRFGMSPQLGANGQTPVNTLAFNIAKNFDNGVTRFQVRIDPPELGRVDVKLDMTVEGRVRAHLTVERSETLELMMRDARSLEKALADTGLNLTKDSLSFSLKDQGAFSPEGGGFGNETGNPSAPDTAPTDIDETLPEQMTRGYISDSGVDIKV